MKILFIVSDANAYGGTEVLAFNILHALRKKGIDCYLFSQNPYHGSNPAVLSFIEKDYKRWLNISRNPLNKLLGNVWSDAYMRKKILEKAKEIGTDWIVNHTYDLCAAIPTKSGIRTAQILHWSVKGYEAELEAKYNTYLKKIYGLPMLKALTSRWHKALPTFDKIVPLTFSAEKELMGIVPCLSKDLFYIIPNPVMYEKESPCLSSLRNKNVVFVGRLSLEKGVIRLLNIWKKIESLLPDVSLSIYGDGYMEKEMRSFIKDHHLNSVKMMGYCDNKEQIYKNADLLLMTSSTEGFGLVIIEAMYYGVPCIAFDCPVSPKEVIADSGITIPCFDEDAYAQKVVEILKNTNTLQILQEKSIERAKSFYINKVAEQWINMFNNLR